jgi:hypothetical protein
MNTIYDPITMTPYPLYSLEGRDLLRKFLKYHMIQNGGATNKTVKTSNDIQKSLVKYTNEKRRNRSPSPVIQEEEETDMFFNKRIPKDFRLGELPEEMVSFMNTYSKKDRADLMKFLAPYHSPLSNKLRGLIEPIPGPNIKASHIYNACTPIQWQNAFLSSHKLINMFFNRHSNCEEVTRNMMNIFKEDTLREEGMETSGEYRNVEQVLDGLFAAKVQNQPFYSMTMGNIAASVIDLIEETIAAFAILKTPSFNMKNEFDRQLILHYLNHYGLKYYTPILDVYNHIKVAFNEAIIKMTDSYKKQNLTKENINEYLKIIVVGNERNFNKVTEKITRFRNLTANRKKAAMETKEGTYTFPIPYYACIKVDILGDLVFTVTGGGDLVYMNVETGELVRTLEGIMKKKPDQLIMFYSKPTYKSQDAKNILVTDKRSKLDKYYDISVELYIYKLLSENKILPKKISTSTHTN